MGNGLVFSDINHSEAIVGVHLSEYIIEKSSSGGAFTAICEKAIADGYVVFGVQYADGLKVEHSFAETLEECEAFRKSKYILSNPNGYFHQVESFLRAGKKVLFSGVPCQCAALLLYLKCKKVSLENLTTVDIICHGAPSQYIFDKYIEEHELEGNSIESYTFKQKKPINSVINSRSAEIVFGSGNKAYVTPKTDPFLKGYYSRLFYRPSCGVCRFARLERVTDITLGDAWGIDKLYSEWDPKAGVSLIIANTEKGKTWITSIKDKFEYKSVTLQWAAENNLQLSKPTEMHSNRSVFFNALSEHGFRYAVEKATHRSLFKKIISKIQGILLNRDGRNWLRIK